MELTQHRCKNCGGSLQPFAEGKLKCPHCGSVYDVQSAEKHTKQMQQLFDEAKQERINNLRRNLYNAINAEYISSAEIHEVCTELKHYLPDDFQANFYDVAVGSNVKQLTRAIRAINVEENYEDLDGVILYLVRSLQTEYLLELNNLVERAYKLRDLKKFELYSTAISEEAQKVQMLIYETKLPRDVFVAYSSKDMDQVSELVSVLEEQGLKCFVAARNLRHGKGAVENYNRALEEAMEHCKSFVFVSSRNSRSINCDALEIEIPFIQKKDIENAPAQYRNNYASIPHQYKKPRVEYRLEESVGLNVADSITNEFFDGYERVYSPAEVAHRIVKQLLQSPEPMPVSKEPTFTEQKKYCNVCGAENTSAAKFCSECGNGQFVASVAEFIRISKQQQENVKREATKQVEAAKKEAAQREAEAKKAAEKAAKKAAQKTTYASSTGTPMVSQSDKNPWVTLLLCIFLGSFGAHRFYVGKKKSAILYIFTCGGFGIGALIDLILIASGNFKDEYKERVRFKKMNAIGVICLVLIGIVIVTGLFRTVSTFVDGFMGSLSSTAPAPEESLSSDIPNLGSDDTDDTSAGTEDSSGLNIGAEYGYEHLLFETVAGGYSVRVVEGAESKLSGELYIPEELGGTEVVQIPAGAFKNCTKITSLVVPNTVTSIGEGAFGGCAALKSVVLPFVGGSDTASDEAAMFGYIFGQEDYTGASATQQQYHKEYGSWNKTYYIPSQLSSVELTDASQIYYHAFHNCSMIKSVEINDYVLGIGNGAFAGCTSLTKLTLPSSITAIPNSLMDGCSSLEEFSFDADSVTSIGDYAFNNCHKLATIHGESGCFSFSDNIESIGYSAFGGCDRLRYLEIPFVGRDRNATEEAGMFGYIFGETAYTGGTATVQQYHPEYGSWSKTYYLPTQLKKVMVTDADQLAYHAFHNCSTLTELNLNDGIMNVGNYVFDGCSGIGTLSLPNVKNISHGLFRNCSSLTTVDLNSEITEIGVNAFLGCAKLDGLFGSDGYFQIPDTVTSIGSMAFSGCVKMKHLSVPFVGKNAMGTGEEGLLGYIFGTDSYTGGTAVSQRYSESYSSWTKTYYLPSQLRGVTVTNAEQISYYAFQNCTQLEWIEVYNLDSVNVHETAFYNCVLPNGMIEAGLLADGTVVLPSVELDSQHEGISTELPINPAD